MAKKIYYDTEARNGLMAGANKLADAVKVTLGAKGRFVTISRPHRRPQTTKDGVTVAKEIELEDPLENVGAQMVKEVASKTDDLAGDGTTTATVLAQSIAKEGLKNVTAGANPMEIKRGIDKAVKAIVEDLEEQSIQIDQSSEKIRHIASISANNDDVIGGLIADAFGKVGKEGVIHVEPSKTTETSIEEVDGMKVSAGLVSPYFITDMEKMETNFDAPFVLVTDKKISRMVEIKNVLEAVLETNRPLMIIADNVDGEALSTLIVNKQKGILNVSCVKAPSFGQMKKESLEDIAILTGATLITEDTGLSLHDATMEHLGEAQHIVSNRYETTIVQGAGSEKSIDDRIKMLRHQIENSEGDTIEGRLQDRLAKLTGGVAILYIGAGSEVEMEEKRDRVVDALKATRASVEEGIVAGGGIALIRAVKALDKIDESKLTFDERVGIKLVAKAIEAPLRIIVENAGAEGAVIVQRVKEGKGDFGYNAKTGEYVNMIEAGIIDPKKVTRVALENASSVAGMILTSECVLIENPTDSQINN